MLNYKQKALLNKIAREDQATLRGRDIGALTGAALTAGIAVPVNKFMSGSWNPMKWQTGSARNVNSILKNVGAPKQSRIATIKRYKFGKKHPILSGALHLTSLATPTYLAYSIGKGMEKDKQK